MMAKILIAAVIVLGLFTGWQSWALHNAYQAMRDAPQGQSIGPADAKITIVEFMDYRCAPCRALDSVTREVAAKHPEVRIVFRHLPVYQKPSVNEARIALAAGKQGKFKAMHDILINRTEPVQDSELPDLCAQAAVDCVKLQTDMKGRDISETLLKTLHTADLLGIHADPTFLIGQTIYKTDHGMPTAANFDTAIAAAQGNGI